MSQPGNRPKFEWIINLGRFIGQKMDVETRDGTLRREAILTKVVYRNLKIAGVSCGLPIEIVLDAEEVLPFDNLVYLRPAVSRSSNG